MLPKFPFPLPTDNLYKFLALGGLVTFVTNQYFQTSYLESNHKLRIEMGNQIDTIIKRTSRKKPEEGSMANVAFATPEDEKRFTQLTQAIDRIMTEEEDIQKDLRWAYWGSLIMTTLGFFLWWRNTQRPMDILLAREAGELNTPVEKTETTSNYSTKQRKAG